MPQKPDRVNGGEQPREHRPPQNDDPARRAYVEAAFADEVKAVATAFAGGRNDALNVAALKLGQLVAGGWLDEGRVQRALEDAAGACGLTRDDGLGSVRATIKSGLAAGMREPRDPPERHRSNGASVPPHSEPAIEVPPTSEKDAGGSPIPNLCEAFWVMRPVLAAIRKSAHSHACSADAALGYLLARTAAFMPHRVRIDSGILKPTPPNLFALLIGTAGAGKSSTHQVFREVIVPANMDAGRLPARLRRRLGRSLHGHRRASGRNRQEADPRATAGTQQRLLHR